jgi:hypothetical protein
VIAVLGKPAERRGRTALFLACMAFVTYNANFRGISAGDSLPARFLPFAILREGTLHLDSVYEATRMNHPQPYWIMRSVDGHMVSMYPIVTPILVTPVYVPAFAAWRLLGGGELRLERLGEVMEKVAGSVLASVSVGLCYVLVRRRLERRDAILLTVAFAFGTNTWMTSSQGLWQHGAAELLLLGALVCVTAEPSAGAAIGTGVFCGLVVANRLPDIVLALGICAYAALFWAPRRAWLVALSGAAAAFPFFLYNWVTFHDWGGGYAVAFKIAFGNTSGFFRSPIGTGLAGLLVSPGKGLLVFCPFFLFLAGHARSRFAARSDRRLAACLALAATAQLLLYARTDWRGGFSYGPRFLTDMVPVLIFLLIPVVAALSWPGRLLFAGATAVAIAIQAIGASCYPRGASDVNRSVWRPGDAPFLVEMRAGPMPPTFLIYARKLLAGKLGPVEPAGSSTGNTR